MHEKDARLASGRWAVVHGNVAPGADLDGLDEEAGFQGGGDGGHGPAPTIRKIRQRRGISKA